MSLATLSSSDTDSSTYYDGVGTALAQAACKRTIVSGTSYDGSATHTARWSDRLNDIAAIGQADSTTVLRSWDARTLGSTARAHHGDADGIGVTSGLHTRGKSGYATAVQPWRGDRTGLLNHAAKT